MSSYEDVYGMAMSVFEALQNIQWKGPRQWELESIIDPISEQLILKLSKSQNLAANPTLAAPTNIRHFLNNIQISIDDPTQLFMFISFLIAVPLFSTFFVAMLTNVNIVLKVLGLPLARNPVKASPLAVIFLMVTVFGNIPLVNFFPERATHVQALLPVQPGHYHGVIARVLQIVAFYEQFELAARLLLEIVSLVRYRRLQVRRLLRPASIAAWLLTFAGFALRMWFTRVSTDTATSPVQSGSTIWAWGKVILRTDISYQSPDEFNDDVFIWVAYFATTFCVSSLFAKYALTPRHEVYQPVEPTIIKVTGSSSILTASAGCQTTVSGDDWVTKSSVALDARKIDRIQAVIDKDMNRTAYFARNWCNETEDASEDLKELTLIWQNDHTALQTHVSLLRSLRMIVEHHREDARKQRQYADKVSAAVRRLEETVNQREKDYDEKLKLREKEYQDRIDALLVKVTALEKGTDVSDATLDDTNEKQASQPDASLGPREAESHSVLANTPELQKTPETSPTVKCAPKSDTKSSSDPLLPSPPLSPPNADGSSSSSGSSNGDKNQESSAAPVTDTIEVNSIPLAATVSSTTEAGVEPEKASDSEMDAANASGSDDEIVEEIGTDIWSRVQKFKFRCEPFTVHKNIVRQHFTVQEIQKIMAMLIDFRDNVANETQREQVSIILNAGFPYRMSIKFASDLDYLSVFLDLAELHKKPTKERVFTQLPSMVFSCVCGVHPQRIGMRNGHRKTWRTFPMKAYMESKLDKAVGEEKEYIQKNSARLLRNLDRLLGERPELWNHAVPAEVRKTDQVWDMNLMARRLLENLGLIEFREVTTEGTSTEEYIPPALTETAPIEPTTNETPSTETPSAAIPTTVLANDSPSIEKQPATMPTSIDILSTEVPAANVPTTVPTCDTSPVEGPSVEPPVIVPTCSETPSVEVPLSEPPAALPICNDPSPAQPLATVSPDEPAQLQTAATEEVLLSSSEATPGSSDSPVAPCHELPSQISPPVLSQAQPPLTPSSSSLTPTQTTPFKFTAPDWRQEALQDLALQQQIQRPTVSGSQRNGRKSRGGKGRPRHSNT